MLHCALTAERSARINTQRRFLLIDGFSSKCGGRIPVGDVALARDGIISETRKGCDIGSIDEVVNADGSMFASLHDDLLPTKRRSPGTGGFGELRDPIKNRRYEILETLKICGRRPGWCWL